jgi:hypothetical protein
MKVGGQLYSRERAPGTHWTGGWVGPRAGLDDVDRRIILPLPALKLRPLGRPARSQSLSWLNCDACVRALLRLSPGQTTGTPTQAEYLVVVLSLLPNAVILIVT